MRLVLETTDPALPGSPIPPIVWVVFAVVFAALGAGVAHSRRGSEVLGALLGLCCGPFGLLFVYRLPVKGSLKDSERRVRLLATGPELESAPISREVAEKLGLPPQAAWSSGQSFPAGQSVPAAQPLPPTGTTPPLSAGTPPPWPPTDTVGSDD